MYHTVQVWLVVGSWLHTANLVKVQNKIKYICYVIYWKEKVGVLATCNIFSMNI